MAVLLDPRFTNHGHDNSSNNSNQNTSSPIIGKKHALKKYDQFATL